MSRSGEAATGGETVPSLVFWGRSPDADVLYRRLVTFGSASPPELARDVGMPRKRVADALDELASIGAAALGPAVPGLTAKWRPRPPAEVIASLRRHRLRLLVPDAQRERHERQELTRAMASEAAAQGDGLRHLTTRQLTRARLAELAAVARHEHLAMNTERIFEAESARPAVSTDRRLLERGVRMRVLGVQPAVAPDPLLQYGRRPSEASPRYREAPTVPMKLFVVDRKIALFPVAPDDFSRGYLEVAQSPVVGALVAMFEKHWAAGRDPGEHERPQIRLAPRDRALLALLAQGYTDANAARKLRVSPRTITNVVRSLMDQIGVDNRFQLGLALGALRIVSPMPRSRESGQQSLESGQREHR